MDRKFFLLLTFMVGWAVLLFGASILTIDSHYSEPIGYTLEVATLILAVGSPLSFMFNLFHAGERGRASLFRMIVVFLGLICLIWVSVACFRILANYSMLGDLEIAASVLVVVGGLLVSGLNIAVYTCHQNSNTESGAGVGKTPTTLLIILASLGWFILLFGFFVMRKDDQDYISLTPIIFQVHYWSIVLIGPLAVVSLLAHAGQWKGRSTATSIATVSFVVIYIFFALRIAYKFYYVLVIITLPVYLLIFAGAVFSALFLLYACIVALRLFNEQINYWTTEKLQPHGTQTAP